MAWVYLDDHFPDHPKVVAAGGDAGWLFVCGLAYIKRYATGGTIPKSQVPRLSDRKAPTRLARRLVDVGLWEDDGGSYHVHDYHDWNKPEESRTAAARKAAKARWAKHASSNANAPADAHANAPNTHHETHSERMAEAYASECPPPLPTEELTSSYGLTTADETPDDDDPAQPPIVVLQAIGILARRDLAERQTAPGQPPIGDPAAWENAAYKRRLAVAWPLVKLAGEHPDWTAQELAGFAEPEPLAAGNGAPRDPRVRGYDEQQRAELRRAEEHMRALKSSDAPARPTRVPDAVRDALFQRSAPEESAT
jgi:hypothetical protein